MLTRIASVAAALPAIVLLALPLNATAANEVEGSSSECPDPDTTFTVEEVPDGTSVTDCRLVGDVLVSESGGAVAIPPPGTGVTLTEIVATGPEPETFTVVVGLDGEITSGDDSQAGTDGAGQNECDNTSYSLMDRKWFQNNDWKINRGSIPEETINRDNAVVALRDGATNITQVNNNCNLADDVGAVQNYQGDTNAQAQITYDYYGGDYHTVCQNGDDKSSVAFGVRQPGVLASACTWVNSEPGLDKIKEGDIEVSTSYNWTTNGASSGCSNAYDLESVATHEFGHIFGLNHSNSVVLTMSPSISKCDNSNRSLAFGDVLGLRQRY